MSVRLKLEKLAQKEAAFDELAIKLNLKVIPISEYDLDVGDNFEVINKNRIGLTEYQVIKNFAEAIVELIRTEKDL